ncbi:histone deacetylase complex subunit SAP18-like [Argiope bruennichi]|uniref:18 kDa Sin3-associated polypeptide n=1 Tax=Argiope bruennichi TaxID=94029 RepID=A0A8T0F5C5_ARGBR|nr:histone deacetylase complex subunit SAP18-like [Argiope bruennichi]KAF8785518.1 Histone deacetylase complex subunit SAP18 like protein [Argiope bruennichi]
MSKKSGVVGSVIEEKRVSNRINRDQTCPMLLRIFVSSGRHNSVNDFSRGRVPGNEFQVHTWMDVTLKELTQLIQVADKETRRKDTYFDFALVFPDTRGTGYRMRDIGSTCSGQKGADDEKTLTSCRFQLGDYLDIAITPPSNRREPATYRRR